MLRMAAPPPYPLPLPQVERTERPGPSFTGRGAFVPQHPACERLSVLPLIDGEFAVHQQEANTRGVLVWLVKRGPVDKGLGIEDDDIGIVSRFQVTTLG